MTVPSYAGGFLLLPWSCSPNSTRWGWVFSFTLSLLHQHPQKPLLGCRAEQHAVKPSRAPRAARATLPPAPTAEEPPGARGAEEPQQQRQERRCWLHRTPQLRKNKRQSTRRESTGRNGPREWRTGAGRRAGYGRRAAPHTASTAGTAPGQSGGSRAFETVTERHVGTAR